MTATDHDTVGDPSWVDAVLEFWFGELDQKAWFTKSAELDARIRDRFLGLHEQLRAIEPDRLLVDAKTALAAILVFDQFPRNMFRDSPGAFATDDKALVLARAAVEAGLDDGLEEIERIFVYLPFEHSEALADQDTAVELIGELGDDAFTRYAIAHRDVIREFGRFPHRNAILGRPSTPEEAAYLAKPGSSF